MSWAIKIKGYVNETEIDGGYCVVAHRQTAAAFELVQAAFDPVPHSICDGIDEDQLLVVEFAGDDGRAVALFDDTADMTAVVATVGDEHLGLGKVVIVQHVAAFEIGDIAAASFRLDWQSINNGNEADIGREATFDRPRPSFRVPHFARAAKWWRG